MLLGGCVAADFGGEDSFSGPGGVPVVCVGLPRDSCLEFLDVAVDFSDRATRIRIAAHECDAGDCDRAAARLRATVEISRGLGESPVRVNCEAIEGGTISCGLGD
jgi:hypothetical protein